MIYFLLIKRTANMFIPQSRNILYMTARKLAALDKQHLHAEKNNCYQHQHYGQNYYFHWLCL